MKINLLCGDRNLPHHLLESKKDEEWGGIDRGALILTHHDIQPIFSLGDFDSVSDEERLLLKEKLEIEPVKAEKADTDLGLGVKEAVECGFNEIYIYGATGGRLDHFLGALQLLQVPEYLKAGIEIYIVDRQNIMMYLEKGTHEFEYDDAYPYISFIPKVEDTILTLEGFKYPLYKQTLHQGSTLTISNEISKKQAFATIEVGSVLAVRSRDLKV